MRQYDVAFAGKPMSGSYGTVIPDCFMLELTIVLSLHRIPECEKKRKKGGLARGRYT